MRLCFGQPCFVILLSLPPWAVLLLPPSPREEGVYRVSRATQVRADSDLVPMVARKETSLLLGGRNANLAPVLQWLGWRVEQVGWSLGWKQEAVPRAKDDRQCKAKPWLHSKVCGRAEFFSGFVGCGEGEVKWGWPEGLSCFSGLCFGRATCFHRSVGSLAQESVTSPSGRCPFALGLNSSVQELRAMCSFANFNRR